MTSLHVAVASLHVVLGHLGSTLAYRRRFGKSPLVVYQAAASPHRTWSRISGALALAWGVVFVASVYSKRVAASPLGRPLAHVPPPVAWVIAFGGLVLMCAAQLAMGEAFRIGQDASAPPAALHRRGLHAWCRNPIYVGSWLALAGMTLWSPSVALVVLCVATGIAMHGLVRAEEVFLAARFPLEFAAYAARVPRYGSARVVTDPTDAIEASAGVGGLAITRAELDELQRPRPLRVIGMTVFLFACWGGLGVLAWRTEHLALRLVLWAIAGFLVNGLVQLGHDAWHHNLFARRWQNALYGHAFSIVFGVSFSAARHAHLRHHWYNRTERDPDAYNVGARGFTVQLQYYVVVFGGLVLSPLHFNLLYPLAFYERRQWPRHLLEVALYAGVYVLVFGGVLVPHGLVGAALCIWLMPIVFATPWNGVKSVADHYANVWKGDRFHTATTVRTARAWSWLWNGLNYHLDHHLYPRVPGYRLAEVHARIRPELERRGAPVFDGYFRIFWGALRDGPTYVDDGHAFLKGKS